MKQIGLPLATLGVLILTAAVLHLSGWFTPRSHQSHSANALAHNQRPTEASLHYRQNSANHWRSYVLAH
jgi:hypothetical protein